MVNKSLLDFIRKIIIEESVYYRNYTGKVVDTDDPDKLGRVKCQVIELGWTKDDTAIWCYANDKRSLTTVKKDDYVRISFMNKDISRAYYTGIMTEMEGMLPDSYEDKNTQILFEDNKKRIYVKYNEEDKEFIINDEDGNNITINTDGIIITDSNSNEVVMDSNGMILTDTNGNKIEMKASGIVLNEGTEAFVLGTSLDTDFTTFLNLLKPHTHDIVGVQAGAGTITSSVSAGLATATNPITNNLSTEVKGK